jgi:hypothetical protein
MPTPSSLTPVRPPATETERAALDRSIRRAWTTLRWTRVAVGRARNPGAVLAEAAAQARLDELLERRRAPR